MTKVSICVPVYNVEKYIGRCLDSLVCQSFKDIEIIVVNDCTPDNSMEVVKRYAKDDERIKIINHDTNLGLMWTRRTGYMAAKGDYITFCDSDDWLPIDAIKNLYDKALELNADIVSGEIQMCYDDGTTKSFLNCCLTGSGKNDIYQSLLTKTYPHNLCSKLFKRDLLQGHDYITLKHHTNAEDGMLFYQVVQHVKKAFHINEVVYIYYQNRNSSTHSRLNEIALIRLVEFYNFIINIPYNNNKLQRLALCYATECLNEFALNQGYRRMKLVVQKHGLHPYLNCFYRLRFMSMKQNLRWYTKYILKLFKEMFYAKN